jgi:hypothetical protein
MRALRRPDSRARFVTRIGAVVLTAALALAFGPTGRGGGNHKHLPRGITTVAVVTADAGGSGGPGRTDLVIDLPGAAPVTALAQGPVVAPLTAAAPQVATIGPPPARGPPAPAAA